MEKEIDTLLNIMTQRIDMLEDELNEIKEQIGTKPAVALSSLNEKPKVPIHPPRATIKSPARP